MSAGVKITRTGHNAAELRAIAGRCRDGAQVRRLLALAKVPEGCPRAEAAERNGMDRQTLRDWAHRYNEVWCRRTCVTHQPRPDAPAECSPDGATA